MDQYGDPNDHIMEAEMERRRLDKIRQPDPPRPKKKLDPLPGVCTECGNPTMVVPGEEKFARCKVCVGKDYIEQNLPEIRTLMRDAGSPGRFLDAKLEDFPKKVLKAFDPELPLLLVGPNGTGKTHLLAGCMRHHLLRGRRCYWCSPPEWLEAAREYVTSSDRVGRSNNTLPSRSSVEFAMEVPHLFIDDFGTEKMTDWAYATFYRVFNYRYNELLPTWVTTNDIDSLDPRFFHRLVENQMISLVGHKHA